MAIYTAVYLDASVIARPKTTTNKPSAKLTGSVIARPGTKPSSSPSGSSQSSGATRKRLRWKW